MTRMLGDIGRLVETEKAGAFLDGYHYLLNDILNRVNPAGLIVIDQADAEFMLYVPVLCRYCRRPLDQSLRRLHIDYCGDCDKRGEDAR